MGKLRLREVYEKPLQGQAVSNKDFSDASDDNISMIF